MTFLCDLLKTVIKCVSKLPGYVFEIFENQYSNVSSMRQFFVIKSAITLTFL